MLWDVQNVEPTFLYKMRQQFFFKKERPYVSNVLIYKHMNWFELFINRHMHQILL